MLLSEEGNKMTSAGKIVACGTTEWMIRLTNAALQAPKSPAINARSGDLVGYKKIEIKY